MNTENDVTIAMATQPCRWESALNVIYMLLSQCTRFCICLNGFDSIPNDMPKSYKLIVLLANGKDGNPPDLGCDNKMYWLGDFPGYYATVDDDIIYPPNYIKSLKSSLDKYDKNVIVSYHGHRYFPKDGKICTKSNLLFWYKLKHETEYCHRLGMGVAMCFPAKIGISKEIFINQPKNTGDDELMALWAQRNNIPMICLSTYGINLISNDRVGLKNALSGNSNTIQPRQRLLESYTQWKLNKINSTTEELTIAMATQPHRAEQMLNVVKQLLPYCTRFCIALNNYDDIPVELNELIKKSGKIITILTGDKHNIKDLGNLNKMYWLGDFPGYYATVDDDLNYSEKYIKTLIHSIKLYDDQTICSYHGVKFNVNNGTIDITSKQILAYDHEILQNTQCLHPGMGTAIMHPHKIGISKYEYLSYQKGYSDDIITSIFAQKHNIKCIVVKHNKNDVTPTHYAFHGLYTNKKAQNTSLEQIQAYKNWKYIYTKPLIATIVFNSEQITNECFLTSLYKHTNENDFNLLIVSTANDFVLANKHKIHKNISIINFAKKYGITMHAQAIQRILEDYRNIYDDIIICENDTIVKTNLLNIIDHNVQFIGRNSNNIEHKYWWTLLHEKMRFGCQRYLPILMYFNIKSFNGKELIYEKNDCSIKVSIPTLNINFDFRNTYLSDPGWYFMIWSEINRIKCKDLDIDEYISHMWYGSENRKTQIPYAERLEQFKKANLKYL